MNMKLHINTIAYAKAMGITLAEYNGGEYGSYAGEYRPLKFERIKYKMTNPDGSLDTIKVEDDFFRNTVRILDFMTIKNSKVLKVYGLGDLNSTNAVYQQAIRKAVYKVMNEYQRWGINAEQRNPITYNGEGTSDVAIGSWLNSADFTGSEGWNAINRLSLDKWELDALGNLYFNGMNVDALFETGESLSKTAISKVSESDNSGLTTNQMVARMIGAQLGGTDLATDTTTVPTDAELIATALQALYAGDEGLFLATENIKLKENPVGANERQAHENETIYVRSQATGTTEKIQFVNGQVVVLSTNVQIKDILKEYQDQLNALDTKKADLINVLLKDGSVELVDGYDPIKDYQIATLKKVKEYYNQAVNNIRGLEGSKTLSDFDEIITIIQDRLEDLEQVETLGNNQWTGSTPFDNTGNASILQDKDADGNSPIVTAGRIIVLDIKRSGTAFFGTVKLAVDDLNTRPLTIDVNNVKVSMTAKINSQGVVKIAITTNGYSPSQFEVSKWVQSKSTSTSFASKTELDAERVARQTADNLKFDKTLANAIGGITDVVQLLTHLQAKVDTIINQDLLEDGKDYIVRKIANQRPVYYAINAVLKTDKAHKKGQITIFNEEQVAPSKFADTTLFDKSVEQKVITKVDTSNGILYTKNGKTYLAQWGSQQNINDKTLADNEIGIQVGIADINGQMNSAVIYETMEDCTLVANNGSFASKWQWTKATRRFQKVADRDARIQVLSFDPTKPLSVEEYKYIAKKDITFAEMGE